VPPFEVLEALELLEDELLLEVLEELEEFEELVLEELLVEVVELLLEDVLLDVLELPPLLEDELLLEEEELLEEELLLELPPLLLPTHAGATKLPSCVPWKPKTLLAVWPGAGNCQLCWLVNCHVVPGVLSDGVRVTFHWPTGVMVSGKVSVSVQELSAVVPVLVTLTSTWKKVPPVLDGIAVQLYAANACPFNNRPSNRLDSSTANLTNILI
jgi:hypothetical protein